MSINTIKTDLMFMVRFLSMVMIHYLSIIGKVCCSTRLVNYNNKGQSNQIEAQMHIFGFRIGSLIKTCLGRPKDKHKNLLF